MFETLLSCFTNLFTYLGFIQSRRFKDPLSKEEEAELLQRLENHDQEAATN